MCTKYISIFKTTNIFLGVYFSFLSSFSPVSPCLSLIGLLLVLSDPLSKSSSSPDTLISSS